MKMKRFLTSVLVAVMVVTMLDIPQVQAAEAVGIAILYTNDVHCGMDQQRADDGTVVALRTKCEK